MRSFLLLLMIIIFCSSLQAEEINRRKQMFKSALIPGWGELSQQKNSGYIFLTAEVILWSSVFYFQQESDLKNKASINYAVKYAHIDPEIEITDDYLRDLKKYLSSGYNSGGYNAGVVETAQALYPDDPHAQTEYIENHVYSDEYYWEWEDKTRRYDYAILRKRIVQYSGYIKGITGAIIANHLISALNSLLIANKKDNLTFDVRFENDLKPMLFVNYKF